MNILETDRLILRTWSLDDAETLFRLYSNPELYCFTGSEPFPDVETTRRYMEEYFINFQKERGFGVWAVVEKVSGKLVGSCGLDYFDDRPELGLGYWFDPEYWGRGYATEAARVCVAYAFDKLNAPELASMTHSQNKASQRVLEKAGFVCVEIVVEEDGMEGMLYVAKNPG
jgi:[ribosomal protein S5]-alanine N-acetyltransferase